MSVCMCIYVEHSNLRLNLMDHLEAITFCISMIHFEGIVHFLSSITALTTSLSL